MSKPSKFAGHKAPETFSGQRPARYGYEPHKYPTGNLLTARKIAANSEFDTNTFFYRFNEPLPEWWPKHADGKLVTNAPLPKWWPKHADGKLDTHAHPGLHTSAQGDPKAPPRPMPAISHTASVQ